MRQAYQQQNGKLIEILYWLVIELYQKDYIPVNTEKSGEKAHNTLSYKAATE